ncbi:homocysteine S-methyltransferase [Agaricicola taiwanensis]|uniref:Homocysteine S-methyltransferase n=1 Tax=Agaricicola taiwanensis TaxID=591372 RepID=A0A8J2VL69_9RHOB|nr:homocysteine S-methyltransferase family protein [Agaricicola taiwanensis]GGE30737.1 homocysteine S-methyltransferase [Agaricicola taiwanensis]
MPKYRDHLPQTRDRMFLSDGGMETTLIFHEGQDLPCFASFILLETDEGRTRLKSYYERYLSIARQNGVGFVLDSATWRANPDWGAQLGYNAQGLRRINEASIAMLADLRHRWEAPETPCVISGAVGPRGDGYKIGVMSASEAEEYHRAQVEAFAGTEADMVTAFTLTTVDEAIGIARAARACAIPSAISFTVETDGRLLSGRTIAEAIEIVDQETDGAPAYFMINCAHPTHFDRALPSDEKWMARIGGIKANASSKSHAELDEAETLDAGDPVALGAQYRQLQSRLPRMRILGGCCGTDHRHVAAMARACLPMTASAL